MARAEIRANRRPKPSRNRHRRPIRRTRCRGFSDPDSGGSPRATHIGPRGAGPARQPSGRSEILSTSYELIGQNEGEEDATGEDVATHSPYMEPDGVFEQTDDDGEAGGYYDPAGNESRSLPLRAALFEWHPITIWARRTCLSILFPTLRARGGRGRFTTLGLVHNSSEGNGGFAAFFRRSAALGAGPQHWQRFRQLAPSRRRASPSRHARTHRGDPRPAVPAPA